METKQEVAYETVRPPLKGAGRVEELTSIRGYPFVSRGEFSIMRILAGSSGADLPTLARRLGKKTVDLANDMERLQLKYIVECVTFLDGKKVRAVFSLTPEGRKAFLDILERLYEIPD